VPGLKTREGWPIFPLRNPAESSASMVAELKGFYTLGVLREIEGMMKCPLHEKFDLTLQQHRNE
jgi:hypothetical protein